MLTGIVRDPSVFTLDLSVRCGVCIFNILFAASKMATNERELALRAHIRTLLLSYALTHLTVNYVEYTEDFVSRVSRF